MDTITPMATWHDEGARALKEIGYRECQDMPSVGLYRPFIPRVGAKRMRSCPTHGCRWPCSLDVGGRDERRTHPCRFHAVWSGRFLVKRKAHRRSFVLSFGLSCYELMRLEPPSHCRLFDQRYGCMSSPGRLWYVSKTHRRNFVSTSVLNWYLVTPVTFWFQT